jgi:biopolymer transport protein TolR
MAITNPDHAPQQLVRRRQRRARMAEINVTPFVDVMLVLLIVFMVTAPLLTVGVTVDLPETKASPLPGQDEPLSVSVTETGEIFLQDTPIGLDQLGPRLIAITEHNPEARIFVRGDRVIDYGRVMAVVGAIHAAGYTKVALVTELEDEARMSARPRLPSGRPDGS